MSSHLSLESIC